MNTEQAILSLHNRITSMNSVPLDVVRVPVVELEVVLQEVQRLQAEVKDSRKPLTDEQISKIAAYWSNKEFADGAWRFINDFARGIERAHHVGIKP